MLEATHVEDAHPDRQQHVGHRRGRCEWSATREYLLYHDRRRHGEIGADAGLGWRIGVGRRCTAGRKQ
eukprot:scaffold8214_cov121-Isochrysis_galbana.AAC.19